MRLLAPAKINLHLRVGSPRADGFHPLLSWFCTAGLFDTLILERAEAMPAARQVQAENLVALSCDRPDVPSDERNLVVRVIQAWAREIEALRFVRIVPIRAALLKQIPAGAGLGGGSSDGARALLGVNELFGSAATARRLADFAARFGSDLPFFFHGPSSICTGRGEIVTPIATPTPKGCVLILPPIVMPTPQVYRQFDAMGHGRDNDVREEPDWKAWTKLGAMDLLPRLVNDLEPPAFAMAPHLGRLREDVERILNRPVRMSGSGSSLFTLFDAMDEADRAADAIVKRFGVLCRAAELAPEIRDDLHNKNAALGITINGTR